MNDVTSPPAVVARKRAFGRSLGDFRIDGATTENGLLPAEERLLVDVARGVTCQVSALDWKKPEDLEKLKSDETCCIRATFLRFLALGGDDAAPVHERGLWISRAHIQGYLDLEGCQPVMSLYVLDSYFSGQIILRNAHMKALVLEGSRVGGIAADGAEFSSNVFLRNGFLSDSEVRLPGAKIGGSIECDGGHFKNVGGNALNCESAEVTGAIFLRNGFIAEGGVRLLGVEVGDLDCSGGRFKNAGGDALNSDQIKVTGYVFLRNGFESEGRVVFLSAEIGGSLECDGSSFKNAGDNALHCDRVRATGGVFLRNGFTAEGAVRLLGAEVGGNLDCNRGSFKNAGGSALHCDGVKVTGSVFLRDGFVAEGQVRLVGANIGGNLECNRSTFRNAGGTVINCDNAKVTGTVFLRGGFTAEGTVDLSSAHAQNLVDDDLARGKAGPCDLILDGFTYERIGGSAPTDAKARIGWLMRQRKDYVSTDFRPQPFEQLAKVLADMGHDGDARKVAMAKQRLMIPVRVRQAAWYAKPFVWLLWRLHHFTSGFGYRPIRLIFILIALWLAGAAFYDQASEAGVFAPADLRVTTSPDLVAKCGGNWTRCRDLGSLPGFYALTYSADVVLPVSDLGQRKVWTPSRRGFELSLPFGLTVPIPAGLTTHIVAVQSFLGSLGALLFGAIITGLIKKD